MPAEGPVDLRLRSTLRLPASAAAWVEVDSPTAVTEHLGAAQIAELSVLPIGAGSNAVFIGHINAMFLRYRGADIEVQGEEGGLTRLRVGAGCNWHDFVGWCLEQGFCGLENLALIPGSVGAAPVQNIGAYGVEVDQFLTAVEAVDLVRGTPLRLCPAECEFGYRDSIFKRALRDRVLITAVEFTLPSDRAPVYDYPDLRRELASIQQPTARQVYDAVVAIRRRKLPDPAEQPNAGSFFKNPILPVSEIAYLKLGFSDMPIYPVDDNYRKVPAAWLIDQCGLKGSREGDIGVHQGHALVLVNHGAGTGEQLLQLVARIQAQVLRRFGISLEVEPRIYRD